MKPEYDVLVVGGGPSGALAAEVAAKAGVSVLLVEKR
ncbi:MAG TPA: FAD-dependent monooxygenase [Methanocorpusculum sp.]|nr:FAD-dependent monooxygenase [Methanocorpusculum sp.]